MNLAAREAMWASQLLEEMGYPQKPITISSDSESAINLTKNSVIGPKSKHIRRQVHYIRDCLTEEDLRIVSERTDDQLADAFTKPLPIEKLKHFRTGMGVVDLS